MAPALANITAIPLPIPRDAPVTRHTFPVNEGSSDVMVQLGDLLHNNGRLELYYYTLYSLSVFSLAKSLQVIFKISAIARNA